VNNFSSLTLLAVERVEEGGENEWRREERMRGGGRRE